MVVGFSEDFTSNVVLDSDLIAVPSSKMYFNSGVHSSITIDNLLQFLPNLDITFVDYNAGVTYGKFEDSRKRSDIVESGGSIFMSITDSNTGNTPASSPTNWLLTDINSLRIRLHVLKVKDRLLTELNLQKRLVDNQYLYSVGDVVKDEVTPLSGDFSGWAFEPKGSDYVAFKINSVAIQAPTVSPVTVSIINQGVLIDTITLNPTADGRLTFEAQTNKILFGEKGRWILAFPSQDVFTNSSFIDALQFDGFVAYTVNGIGSTPEGSDYSISTVGNGLNFNISAYMDANEYVNDNLEYFGSFFQSTFELMTLEMFLRNANNRSNRNERIQTNDKQLEVQTVVLDQNTVAKRWERERREAIKQLEETFDRQLAKEDEGEMEIEIGSI